MPQLSIDDFKPVNVTCEIRYDSAFLVFDRTGAVIEGLKSDFPDMALVSGSPVQTAFTSEKGQFTLEIGSSRFTSGYPFDKKGVAFAKHCSIYFNRVADELNISVFTRIGLRYVARKEFGTFDEAKAALLSTSLVHPQPSKRFNISENPTEVLYRWEDKEIGAFIRLRAESGDVKFVPAIEARDFVTPFEKKIHVLNLDVDYYTTAAVEREQWNCAEWLQTKIRTIQKEVDMILG